MYTFGSDMQTLQKWLVIYDHLYGPQRVRHITLQAIFMQTTLQIKNIILFFYSVAVAVSVCVSGGGTVH